MEQIGAHIPAFYPRPTPLPLMSHPVRCNPSHSVPPSHPPALSWHSSAPLTSSPSPVHTTPPSPRARSSLQFLAPARSLLPPPPPPPHPSSRPHPNTTWIWCQASRARHLVSRISCQIYVEKGLQRRVISKYTIYSIKELCTTSIYLHIYIYIYT
jgi:hypothetical protein